MSFVMLALLLAVAAATALVLADSVLRLRSAIGGLKAQRGAALAGGAGRMQLAVRMTTRISYARPSLGQSAPLRVAA